MIKYNRINDYTVEELQIMANESISIAGMIKKLKYKSPAGGTYSVVKKYLKLYNINTDHWKGMAWSKDEQIKDWSEYSGHQNCKKHLIKKRGQLCENCNLSSWLKNPINLEVHHIDGNRTNNNYDNLKLLCPNCHSFTDSWRKRVTKN